MEKVEEAIIFQCSVVREGSLEKEKRRFDHSKRQPACGQGHGPRAKARCGSLGENGPLLRLGADLAGMQNTQESSARIACRAS